MTCVVDAPMVDEAIVRNSSGCCGATDGLLCTDCPDARRALPAVSETVTPPEHDFAPCSNCSRDTCLFGYLFGVVEV